MMTRMARTPQTGDRHKIPVRAVRVERELWLAMKAAAETDGKLLNDAVIELFEAYVDRVSTERSGAYARNLDAIVSKSGDLK